MTKYYAVRVGRETGIFNSWGECKKQVDGFSGASYKSFTSLEDAKNYLNLDKGNNNNQKQDGLKTIEIYVDGSYNERSGLYSYGCIILDDEKTKLSGVGTNPKNASLRNVAGELLGAMEAVKWACNNKFEKVKIFHDYEGISKWATGEWNATKEGTKDYVLFLKEMRDRIQIQFIKVKAHSGNAFNEEADILAKKAIDDFISSGKNSIGIIDKNEEVDYSLFKEIMNSDDKRKNIASFQIKGYELSESKLFKVARETWKNKGYKVKDIDAIKVNVSQFEIEWIIIDKNKKEHYFIICLD